MYYCTYSNTAKDEMKSGMHISDIETIIYIDNFRRKHDARQNSGIA